MCCSLSIPQDVTAIFTTKTILILPLIDKKLEHLSWAAGTGEVFKGAAAVITVPLGCLKAGAIAFQPPLPSWKADAIAKLGFGDLNKVDLPFRAWSGVTTLLPSEHTAAAAAGSVATSQASRAHLLQGLSTWWMA